MPLDEVIIAWFCVIDDLLPRMTEGKRLRQRGPAPKLAVSLVLTMEVVGTSLGLLCLRPYSILALLPIS